MYAYRHTHVQTNMHIIYIYIYIPTHRDTYIPMHTALHIDAHIYIHYIHICIYIYAYIHVRLYDDGCIHRNLYIYMYTSNIITAAESLTLLLAVIPLLRAPARNDSGTPRTRHQQGCHTCTRDVRKGFLKSLSGFLSLSPWLVLFPCPSCPI